MMHALAHAYIHARHECMHTFTDHIAAWKLGACESVKVMPNRDGGLTRARQIRDFDLSVGWQMHIEDLGGSAAADTAAIHLAASTPDPDRLGPPVATCAHPA